MQSFTRFQFDTYIHMYACDEVMSPSHWHWTWCHWGVCSFLFPTAFHMQQSGFVDELHRWQVRTQQNVPDFCWACFAFPLVLTLLYSVASRLEDLKKNKGLRRHHGYFSGGKIICTHTTWQPPVIIQRWWHLPNQKLLVDTFSSSDQSDANPAQTSASRTTQNNRAQKIH